MPKQNTRPADYPQAVIHQIALLAQNIVVARKRRKETQAQWAKRLGVSQPTMARIEQGDPSVAMASYVMCMWLINPGASLADVIAPQLDTIALEREIAKVQPRRAPVGANSPQNLKVRPADERRDSLDVTKRRDYGSAAELARGMDSHSAQTAVGLAALIAKVPGGSQ